MVLIMPTAEVSICTSTKVNLKLVDWLTLTRKLPQLPLVSSWVIILELFYLPNDIFSASFLSQLCCVYSLEEFIIRYSLTNFQSFILCYYFSYLFPNVAALQFPFLLHWSHSLFSFYGNFPVDMLLGCLLFPFSTLSLSSSVFAYR